MNGALPAGVTQEDGYPTGTIMNPSRISLSLTFTDRAGLSDTATVTLSGAAAIPVGDSVVHPSTGMLNVMALHCFADRGCLAASQNEQLSLMDVDGR